ncbi:MAG: sulfatase [Planctomycetota bacterium]|nr:sulfatase [Planctomycetota bacterium]
MSRIRQFLLLLPLLIFGTGSKLDAQKPNFVFILVDDLGWMDIGANNAETFYETPNIDSLAATGMRFTNAYAACPVCSPTRASILSGKYPARLHTTDYFGAAQPARALKRNRGNRRLLPASYIDRLPLEEVTLAEALREAGYATFFAGKWHLGQKGHWPQDQGFDINRGGIHRGGPYGGDRYFSPYGNPNLTDGPKGEHLPHRLGQETVRFIHANRDKPFLAYLSFYSVHTPLISRQDLKEKYQRKAKGVSHDGPKFIPEGRRQARQVQDHAVYAGMVEAMDLAVGDVLKALVDDKLASRTTVIFMSDNGGLSTSEGSPTSNVPLRAGKGWMYEGGIREPMIVRWPGVTRAGSVCDTAVVSTDFYPTILEIAGLESRASQHLDGISFTSLLKDPAASLPREAIYWHYPHYGNQGGSPTGAIRVGDFKLIEFYEDNRVELYDLSKDIGEHQNLAATKPEQAVAMRKKLADWRQQVGALMPSPNPKYRPGKSSKRK